jgi:hypothetical protein
MTANTWRPMGYRGHDRRLHLRGGDVPTAISSFALPGGYAP